MGESGDGDDFGQDIVWACTECGRHHQKHSPPCSRCGNVSLEKRRPDFGDLEEPGGTSYLDVLEPKYAAGYAVVLGLALLVALSVTGVVSVPWLFGPSPPGAPGDAETYANVSLSDVERAYVAEINELRAERGVRPLSVASSLDGAATAFNQRTVRAAVGEGGSPDMRDLLGRYEPQCSARPLFDARTASAASVFEPSGRTLNATAVARRLPIAPDSGGSALIAGDYADIGVDVHVAPDETVYATVLVC